MEKPTLILMMGLPYSGKTITAHQIAKEYDAVIVNPDSIRLALHGERYLPRAERMVWTIAKIMVRHYFAYGRERVILDACNISRKRREEWYSSEWNTRIAWISTDAHTCRARAAKVDDREILSVIDRMEGELEPPMGDESLWLLRKGGP